jgi:hypothetical protein
MVPHTGTYTHVYHHGMPCTYSQYTCTDGTMSSLVLEYVHMYVPVVRTYVRTNLVRTYNVMSQLSDWKGHTCARIPVHVYLVLVHTGITSRKRLLKYKHKH